MTDLLATHYCTFPNCQREAEVGDTCLVHVQREDRLPPLVFSPCGTCPDRAGCIELGGCSARRIAAARATHDAKVTLHPHAEAQADATLESLREGVAEGVVIEVDDELPAANQRLMDTLGAKVIVKPKGEPVRDKKPRGYWTKERIIEAIQRWAREHDGAPPTQRAWVRSVPGFPTGTTVFKAFGTWSAAIAAAGLEPRQAGGGPGRGRNAQPSPSPAEPTPTPSAASNGAGTYAERARALIAAAERLDNAQAELESARAAYQEALEGAA